MKTDIRYLACLRRAPLLEGLGDSFCAQIGDAARSRDHKKRLGRIATEELSTRLHFVMSGEMHMMRVSPDGQEFLIERYLPGDFFCLSSLLSGRFCNSFVVSAASSQVLFWSQEWFRRLLQSDARFYGNLLKQMARQVDQERSLRTLSRCVGSDSKLVAYLLHKLDIAHCCIQHKSLVVDLRPIGLAAQELGMARETLSRSLQRLVRMDGISYHRGQVHIADPGLLEQMLEEATCCDNCE
ncbi:MAG TPA: Crp/Fnr family transcriptional regulator [Pelovirga sp.]|nr:Crp/Fnr family transcriptional regulator [Pelovirga sp.]